METINYNGNAHNIVDIILFNGTYHMILLKDGVVSFVNKLGSEYYQPVKIVNTDSTNTRYLEFLRKQFILYCLVDYINNNDLVNDAKIVTEHFKEYIKTNFVDLFLYWPYMDDVEYKKRLEIMKVDIEAFLNKKLQNRVLAPDNETIIIRDSYKVKKKDNGEDDFIPDPSSKLK